jgi:D-Tyr-tRNAtyr deacylase
VVSQFTLQATTKGNRPSYIKAAKPDVAIPFIKLCSAAEKLEKKTHRCFWSRYESEPFK